MENLEKENSRLTNQVQELELKIHHLEGTIIPRHEETINDQQDQINELKTALAQWKASAEKWEIDSGDWRRKFDLRVQECEELLREN